MDKRCEAKRGEGRARQCGAKATAQHRGAWRRMGKETNGSAKDRQRTDTQRRGTAKLGQATNGEGTDALRNERRWQGDALLRYGEAKPRHATAMD